MRHQKRPSSIFCGFFALRIFIFIILSVQVLAGPDRRTPNKAGLKQLSAVDSDTIYIDNERGRSRFNAGSGAGDIDDTDNMASGIGPDDDDGEDEENGSGFVLGGNRGGSGDMDLPPSNQKPSAIPSTVAEPTTTTTTTKAPSTTTTSTRLLPIFTTTTTTKPFMGPVTVLEAEYMPETSASPRFETTLQTIRVTTAQIFTQPIQTTTTHPMTRKRPTITTAIGTTTTKTRETTPKTPPSTMFDDTNKTSQQSFWMRPGVLAGLIGGAVAGLLAEILLVMFVVYRMRKKDEGSYALEEPKSPPAYTYAYQKAPTREFYA